MNVAVPVTTVADARAWIAALPAVSRETLDRLEAYATLLRDESARQNLVAASTLPDDALWTRHMLDSAQLLQFCSGAERSWVDLGSGPGLPGLVVAILAPDIRMTLVESRRLRADFLRHVVGELGLEGRVSVNHGRVEALSRDAHDVISARAFAPLARLIPAARHLAAPETMWLLPLGRNAESALSTLPPAWQRLCRLESSLTDADARILCATGDFRDAGPAKPARNGRNRTGRARRP